MILLGKRKFVGWKRSFMGCLPRDQNVCDMFTYLQDNYDFKNILEFGFRFGHSSTWFLYAFPNAKVTSYDPKEYTVDDEKIWVLMELKYKGRFRYRPYFSDMSRKTQYPNQHDVVFIDAGHTFGAVLEDIKSALILKIPVILIDNMELEEQQRAVNYWKNNLDFVREFEYYTKNRDGLTYRRTVNLYHVHSYDIQESI